MLTEQDKRFLKIASSRYRQAIVVGFVISVAGAAYMRWGIHQLDPQHTPHPETAFDRPIARLALLINPQRAQLTRMQSKTKTKLEQTLLNVLAQERDTTIRLILTLIRVLLGSFALTVGGIFISVGLTQWQFLRVIKKL